MSILNELQVGLVSLLQTFQQQLVLGPLQLQLPHLGDGKRDSMEGGEAGPLGPLGKPSSPHSDTLPLQPAPSQLPRCPSPGPPSLPAGPDSAEAQPGARQCHFEAASEQPAAASGILCPVVGSAPGTLGARTVRGGGDGPGWVGDRAAAELSYLWPSARWTSSALHLIWGLDGDKDMTPRGQG